MSKPLPDPSKPTVCAVHDRPLVTCAKPEPYRWTAFSDDELVALLNGLGWAANGRGWEDVELTLADELVAEIERRKSSR